MRFNSAEEAVNPERAFNSSFPTVTPFMIFNSEVDAVIPVNTFNSAALDVTEVAPNVKPEVVNVPVVSKLPVTLARPLDKVIKPVSLECPMVEPLINTSPASIVPPLTVPVVVIGLEPTLIAPKPEAIDPDVNSPTVRILLLPSLSPYLESAVVSLILVLI